jgi:hypothetical protein
MRAHFKMLLIIKFNFRRTLKFKNYRKQSRKSNNDVVYTNWVMKTLKNFHKNLPKNYTYNSQAIYMNEFNIEILHKNMQTWAWVNWSPNTDKDLKNDEYGIDLNSIIYSNEE